MQLQERLRSLGELAEKLKASGKSLSEANTKVSFIQPVLEDLGWQVSDPDEVILEHPVFDGTFLDYALLIDGKPALYLEAKALRASLDDPKFIAQTVNYANNDGIRWCVLTNGLVYRIYKSDELAPADKKLLAEADIREAVEEDDAARVAVTLSYLSKASLQSGKLDEWGERVFVDVTVRRALDGLIREPSVGLINLIRKTLVDRKLTSKQIRESLVRMAATALGALGKPKEPAETPVPKQLSQTAGVGDNPHTRSSITWGGDRKRSWISSISSTPDSWPSVPTSERIFLKQYVSYKVRKIVVTVVVGRNALVMGANLPFGQALKPPPGVTMRDVSNIGHWGVGDAQVFITKAEDLAFAEQLARQSYERTPK